MMGYRLLLKRIEALEAKLQQASSTSAAAAAAAAADVAPAVGTDAAAAATAAAAAVRSFGRALLDKMKGVQVCACVCVFDTCLV